MKFLKLLFLSLFISAFSYAQVGVNIPLGSTVDPSAAFEIQSGNSAKGMLTPRMTTTDRLLISNPADGLIVYDTDLKSFFHYRTAVTGPPAIVAGWVRMNSEATGRLNFKRIKSSDVLATVLAAEKAAGGGTKYLLNSNTYYEINGAVTFDAPIELNNAYLVGLDANEDKILRSGNLFVGATGGTIKNVTVTVTGGNVFTLAGTDNRQSLLFRDCIVENCTNVGSISKFALVFSSVVQYAGNTTGIVYTDITRLLLNNVAWFGNNAGTFEKYTGTFSLIQKLGGFCEVNGTAIGVDVATAQLAVTTGVLDSVVFTGNNPTGYINPYAQSVANTYIGYNFTNAWTVDSPGIPREGDAAATGDINLSAAVGTGATTTFTGTETSSRKKLEGPTTSNNLFRFTKDGNNRITYRGNKPRYFQVAGSVSYQGSVSDLTIILYIARGNGTLTSVLSETKVYGRGATGFFTSAGILALPIVGTVLLKKDEFIEIWAERYDGGGNMSTVSLNLTAR